MDIKIVDPFSCDQDRLSSCGIYMDIRFCFLLTNKDLLPPRN